ncbi:hypothetical protein OPT61_g4722 [Boeremia exigua]|uniref:Uncharacterized protein n=1 Tax=Boeremia exigua TaxID=749465 RepID=A0ACC2ID84_9PLEO|nr:hypothetical protein OPT61_g4722 [Boeremia exigua]
MAHAHPNTQQHEWRQDSVCYNGTFYKPAALVDILSSPTSSTAAIEPNNNAAIEGPVHNLRQAIATLESRSEYVRSCPTLLDCLYTTLSEQNKHTWTAEADVTTDLEAQKSSDVPTIRRGRGRPRGSKDSQSRQVKGGRRKKKQGTQDCQRFNGTLHSGIGPDEPFITGYKPERFRNDSTKHNCYDQRTGPTEGEDNWGAEATTITRVPSKPQNQEHLSRPQDKPEQHGTEHLKAYQHVFRHEKSEEHIVKQDCSSYSSTNEASHRHPEPSSSTPSFLSAFPCTVEGALLERQISLVEEWTRMPPVVGAFTSSTEMFSGPESGLPTPTSMCMGCEHWEHWCEALFFPRGTAMRLPKCEHLVCLSCLTERYNARSNEDLYVDCPVCGGFVGHLLPAARLPPALIYDMLSRLSIRPLDDHNDHVIMINRQAFTEVMNVVFEIVTSRDGQYWEMGTAHVSPHTLYRQLEAYNASRPHQQLTTPGSLKSALESCIRNAFFTELRRRPENRCFKRQAARQRYTQELAQLLPQLARNEPGLERSLANWRVVVGWVVDILTVSWEQRFVVICQ